MSDLSFDAIVPPSGFRAVLEEYKVPLCISLTAILGMFLYGKIADKKEQK